MNPVAWSSATSLSLRRHDPDQVQRVTAVLGGFAHLAVSQLLLGAPLGTALMYASRAGWSTRLVRPRLPGRLRPGVADALGELAVRDAPEHRLRIAVWLEPRGAHIGLAHIGDLHGLLPLALCGVVIAAGEITNGPGVIATGGVIGAGEIFHGIGEIGVGIAQAGGVAGVTDPAGGRELDLHQSDGAAMADETRLIAAFAHDDAMHQ